MRREVIGRRFGEAARRGREHGACAGQSAAQGLLNLTASAVTAAVLLFGLVAVLVLWFGLLYLWFVLLPALLKLPALWDTLSLCWPFLVACALALLIARLSRFHEPPAPDPMSARCAASRRDVDAAADSFGAEVAAKEPPPG